MTNLGRMINIGVTYFYLFILYNKTISHPLIYLNCIILYLLSLSISEIDEIKNDNMFIIM